MKIQAMAVKSRAFNREKSSAESRRAGIGAHIVFERPDLHGAARFGAAAGALACNKFGAQPSMPRLEAIERIQADPLRSGYMDPVIDFAKARALERLRAYPLATLHYRRAAARESELRDAAEESAASDRPVNTLPTDTGSPSSTRSTTSRSRSSASHSGAPVCASA